MYSSILATCIALSSLALDSEAFVVQAPLGIPTQDRRDVSCHSFSTSGMWNAGLNFGKGDFKFYKSFEDWMSPFPEEDKAEFPEVFNLPKGVYEVRLTKPLGIVFEEIEIGKGLYVMDLVEGGNAERQGRVKPGDVLVGISAVKIVGASLNSSQEV